VMATIQCCLLDDMLICYNLIHKSDGGKNAHFWLIAGSALMKNYSACAVMYMLMYFVVCVHNKCKTRERNAYCF